MTRRDDVLSAQEPADLVLDLEPGRAPAPPADTAAVRTAEGRGRVHAHASRLVPDVENAITALPAEGYTRVLHDVPAAVLLVDVRTRRVLHANPFARRLTGDLALPASDRDWVEAVGLTAPGGVRFEPGSSPVEQAAAGLPVFGEPVAVPDGAERRPLWVTGFPLPQERDALALLVLFDVDSNLPEAQVRDRAVIAAGLSFTISDARRDDNPLIYVNPAFERTTGYTADESLGRNCRFLQGPETDPAAVQRIRDALAAEEHAVVTLLNHRRDGTAFWNEVSLSPVYDGTGALTHFVGIQSDVTARVLGEQERLRHLQAERQARAAAEQAQRRLALLAEATSMLAATLDVEQSLSRLTDLVVPMMADWCVVELLEADGEVRRVASAHVDPAKAALLRRAEELQPTARTADSPVPQVIASGQPLLLSRVPEEVLGGLGEGSELAEIYRALGTHSAVVVPLRARRHVLGALSLVTAESGREYDEDDLTMAADLARRAALTVDNARLYEREHEVAMALQQSLLPQLPHVPGLDCAARYLPSSTAAQVGGDWYDLFVLPGGTLGLAVGDVMGHDLTAAAAMGQLRSVLRSYAWQGGRPADVLDHLDQLVQGLEMAQLATTIYARLDLPDGGGAPGRLCLANAGHLPPVLRDPQGRARLLTGAESLLVGAALDTHRDQLQEDVSSGCLLVLCTDGLVERRDRDPEAGLEQLRRAVEEADGSDAEQICDQLLRALDGERRDDDVALLVVRVL